MSYESLGYVVEMVRTPVLSENQRRMESGGWELLTNAPKTQDKNIVDNFTGKNILYNGSTNGPWSGPFSEIEIIEDAYSIESIPLPDCIAIYVKRFLADGKRNIPEIVLRQLKGE